MSAIEQRLKSIAQDDPIVQRYQQVSGIGVLTATALHASAGPLDRFHSGRHFSAWLGLTPREHSSGTHRRRGRISKRGDGYLRLLLIHGARAAREAASSDWLSIRGPARFLQWSRRANPSPHKTDYGIAV